MRVCVTCSHIDRDEIERGIVTGVSIAELSRRYDISEDSLFHHKQSCMPSRLARGQAAADLFATETIMERLEFIQRETAKIYAESRGKDNTLALKSLARMEQQLNTAVRVREFILKRGATEASKDDLIEALQAGRKRVAAARVNNETEPPTTEMPSP